MNPVQFGAFGLSRRQDKPARVPAESLADTGFACYTPAGGLAMTHAEVAASMDSVRFGCGDAEKADACCQTGDTAEEAAGGCCGTDAEDAFTTEAESTEENCCGGTCATQADPAAETAVLTPVSPSPREPLPGG